MSQVTLYILLIISMCCICGLCYMLHRLMAVIKALREEVARLRGGRQDDSIRCADSAIPPSVTQQVAPQPEPALPDLDAIDDGLVEKAVKYIESNMVRPDLSVEEVSTHLGVSRVYLYKRIKTATGLTPIEFLRHLRLRRAAQMLGEPAATVSEVATAVGFSNPRNFSKYFREEYGVLPSVYQTNNQPVNP